MTDKIVFGCGYLGGRVARIWRDQGDRVHVVTRSTRKADELRAAGYQPIVADIVRSELGGLLPDAGGVLFAVGYDRGGSETIEEVYVRGLEKVLDALPETCGKFIHISSTGVYGQDGGVWVDEQSECRPVRAGGRACLNAEKALWSHPMGSRAVVLRLAGLYGPGRVPYLDRLSRGEPLTVPGDGFLNLIHADDAAAAVIAAETRATPPRIYCASDGRPVERRVYYAEVARQIGAPPPEFLEPSAALPATARAATSKRVSPKLLAAELGFIARFADYRSGLSHALSQSAAAQPRERPGSVAGPGAET